VNNLFSSATDTLRYYYSFKYDSANTMVFIDECLSEGYCEPIAVLFMPDSLNRDSSLKYYSIKKIRICFMNPFDSTKISVHLGDGTPSLNNLIFSKTFSVSENEYNKNLDSIGLGTARFKEIDVSFVSSLQNLSCKTDFWVVLDEKVFAVMNSFKRNDDEPIREGSGHSYTDGLPSGKWSKDTDFDWWIESVVEFSQQTEIIDTNENKPPNGITLYQNFPNPFNSTTEILFYLPNSYNTSILIYNLQGQKVSEMVNSFLYSGYHRFIFIGNYFPSGIYIYRLNAGSYCLEGKMILIK
jgi:hypothetical protein